MPSRIFRVRLDSRLANALTTLAENWGLPASVVLRLALKDLLDNPARFAELLPDYMPHAFEDIRTPEQAQAFERDRQALVHVDLRPLLAAMVPVAQERVADV
jgi:hypothetical protein